MSKEKTVDFEQIVSREEAISYLENILGGLRSGVVKLEHGDQSAEVSTTGALKLNIYVKSSRDKETLAIKMKWRRSEGAAEGSSLKIDRSE